MAACDSQVGKNGKSSHLKSQAGNRETRNDVASQSLFSDTLSPARPRLLNLQNSTTNWGLSVQIHEPMGTSLSQENNSVTVGSLSYWNKSLK